MAMLNGALQLIRSIFRKLNASSVTKKIAIPNSCRDRSGNRSVIVLIGEENYPKKPFPTIKLTDILFPVTMIGGTLQILVHSRYFCPVI